MFRNTVLEILNEDDKVERTFNLKKLEQRFLDLVVKSVETHNTSDLDAFIGDNSGYYDADYSGSDQLKSVNSVLNSLLKDFLAIALNYACKSGSLNVVKYLVEKQRLPGELNYTPSEAQFYLFPRDGIKGSPLSLAAENGHLDIVKYLYEKTDALIETCLEEAREPTALTMAAKNGHTSIVNYLLGTKNANPNSRKFNTFGNVSPLRQALVSNKLGSVQSLVTNDAIVTSEDIEYGLKHGCDLEITQFLLAKSLTKGDPQKYLEAAVTGGNLDNLKLFEKEVSIADFNELKLLEAAAKSGSKPMMQYLVDTKQLAIEKYHGEEEKVEEDKEDYTKLSIFEGIMRSRRKREREAVKEAEGDASKYPIIKSAIESSNDSTDLLQWLFETKNLKPSEEVLKKCCKYACNDLKTMAYVYSNLEEYESEKPCLDSIVQNLEKLELPELFRIYNTTFIQKGNKFATYRNEFPLEIENLIAKKLDPKTLDDVLESLCKTDKEAAIGALNYFAKVQPNYKFRLAPLSKLIRLLGVNSENCMGDTPIKIALEESNFLVADFLMLHRADPDVMNHKGETALTGSITWFEGNTDHLAHILGYQPSLKNSLGYITKSGSMASHALENIFKITNGEIGNFDLKKLLVNCLQRDEYDRNNLLAVLVEKLSVPKFRVLVSLLDNEKFLQENNVTKEDICNIYARLERSDIRDKEDRIRLLNQLPNTSDNPAGFFRRKSAEKLAASIDKIPDAKKLKI